ncbi:hypothetical protein [Paraburkholderia sp. JHI869]|uniref:TubC N-terminal docking domain-related protein n=1 Tax=Paraburkholderia sp. JHI869 TaxID=3112959 RepID=UPI003171992A
MNAPEILARARAMGVHLRIDGDRLRMKGPPSALEELKPEVAANKPEIIAFLNAEEGALIDPDPDGGVYLPWGPYLSPDDVRRTRVELVEMIKALAGLESWPPGLYDDVMTRAVRGPLSDLLPNIAHFAERLTAARAEAETRALYSCRVWRYEPR